MAGYEPVNLSETQVDNFTIWCMDSRFDKAYRHTTENDYGVDVSDGVRWAAPSKSVADGTIIPMIQLAHEHHGITEVDIFDHIDCLGFREFGPFDDEDAEIQAHLQMLRVAKAVIRQAIPDLKVNGHILGTHGEIVLPIRDKEAVH